MPDFLFEMVEIQRIALLTKLISQGNCSCEEKDIAIGWLSVLAGELDHKIKSYE